MTKKLTTIISENWETFSNALNIDLENKFENYLLMINKIKPSIKLLDRIIRAPNYKTIELKIKINDPDYNTLRKMELLKYDSNNETFSISYKAREITEGLYNMNNPEFRRDDKKEEIVDKILENKESW